MEFEGQWRPGTLADNLAARGVKRRDFMKFCSGLAAIFAAGTPMFSGVAGAEELHPGAQEVADALGKVEKPNVVWLQLQECTGCMESTIRSGGTTVEDMVLDLLSMPYNDLLMAPSGHAAEKALHDANQEPHILVVNGSIPMGEAGAYCTIGGKSAEQVLREAAENATAVLAVGACAVYGSVQAARPNPTGAVGVEEILKDTPVINVSGCPPIGEVITATITYVLTHGHAPEVDAEGRPLFAYDQRIHDTCPRRAHFDAGQFVRVFDDEGARNGWCLYEVGCKGPSTFSPCPIIQWNLKSGWPIGAGHPCIGCTERDFFDKFTPFYDTLPDLTGIGVEASAAKVGLAAVGVAAAGVGVHAGITTIRQIAMHRGGREEKVLATFGPGDDDPRVTGRSGVPGAELGDSDAAGNGPASGGTTDSRSAGGPGDAGEGRK
ncbi:hydrogenase small subunit [Corynebacterium sp. 335C]